MYFCKQPIYSRRSKAVEVCPGNGYCCENVNNKRLPPKRNNMKQIYSLALSAALALLSAPAFAGDGNGGHQQKADTQAKRTAKGIISQPFAELFGDGNTSKKLEKEYPLLFKTIRPGDARPQPTTVPSKSMRPTLDATKMGGNAAPATTALPASQARNSNATATGRELWGAEWKTEWSSYGNNAYGLYSMTASAPVTPQIKIKDSYIRSDGGAALTDGVYHSVEFDKSMLKYGLIYIYHTRWDVATGQRIGSRDYYNKDRQEMAAIATAQDYATGTVYGVFYSHGDLNKMELGIADYSTFTRTTIAEVKQFYVAMGLGKDGFLYGVSSDGNLYKIDKADGSETKIGPTGLTLETAEGKVYPQSGEIDQKTNIFYWAATDAEGNCALYTVNLSTGAATLIGAMPGNVGLCGMVLPLPAAEDGAPAQPSQLEAHFDNGATSGTLSFVLPSNSYAGESLDPGTELDYKVYASDELKAEGKGKPGETVKVPLENMANGLVKFYVTASNAVGSSPKAETEAFVGIDTPKPVSGLKLNIDKATGVATLTWTAPETGTHNGYTGKLTYNVTRYPDAVQVATGLEATSFSETLDTQSLKSYSYGVVAIGSAGQSAEERTETQLFGQSIVPPYEERFDDAASVELYTITDANADGKTWEWNDRLKVMVYKYSSSNNADDWLVSPPLKLSKGHIYNVSFRAWSEMKSSPEQIEVKYGTASNPASMETTLLPTTELPANTSNTYSKEIAPSESGDYYIAFHATSQKNAYYLYLDDIKVEVGRSAAVPGKPQDLKAVPGERGALTAKVSLTAPETDYMGNPLAQLTKVEVLRNDSLVKTFESPQPGQQLTYDDKLAKSGEATYTAIAYNENGAGNATEPITIFIGSDKPKRPAGITLADNKGSVTIKWNKVPGKGGNGGYVNPEDVVYTVYDIANSENGTSAEAKGETKETSYTVTLDTSEGQEQKAVQYGVSAKNAAGESSISLTPPAILGKPYKLPFTDSFEDSKTSHFWWVDRTAESQGTALTVSSVTADNDGGAIYYMFKSPNDSIWFSSGKISLDKAEKPTLTFSHSSYTGEKASVTVQVLKADGTTDNLLTYDYASQTGERRWTQQSVSLEPYKDEPYIIVRFLATSESEVIPVYLDNVSIRNHIDNDLAIDLTAPKSQKRGIYGKVRLNVRNEGLQTASGYTVRLMADGKEIESQKVNEDLASYTAKAFEFSYRTPAGFKAATARLTAEVVYASDQDTRNNVSSATVDIVPSTLPQPLSVTATKSGDNVRLEWVMPSTLTEIITDDFESYTPWRTGTIGPWTMIDADNAKTGGFSDNYRYTGEGQPFAYLLFNPDNWIEGITEQMPSFKPHSGQQYLASMWSHDDQNKLADNDDWLVSPELPGTAQTISFWVSDWEESGQRYEHTFEVLVSKTEPSQTAFYKLGDTYTQTGGTWHEITVNLPEGARYFAIRNTTKGENASMFMIDDITYCTAAPTLTGFNIYRDGQKLRTVAAETRYYDDDSADGSAHSYMVTAMYGTNESDPATTTVTTGISAVESQAVRYQKVYAIDGRLVSDGIKAAKGVLRPGVYIAGGKKIVVK